MKNRYLLLLFLISFCLPDVKSQESKLDSLLDVILFEDEELISLLTGKTNFQFLYLRTQFENQSYFSGRDIGIEQQNYTAQATYFHSIGFNADNRCGRNYYLRGGWFAKPPSDYGKAVRDSHGGLPR